MSTTRTDLLARRRLLWVATAAATVMLMWAYWGVQGPAAPLRRQSVPAVLAVDTARSALKNAGVDTRTTGGAGEFQKEISVVYQSLAQAPVAELTGRPGEQTQRTLIGLVTVYTGLVEKAQDQPAGSVLHEAYLSYADSVLNAKPTGLIARLDDLQKNQLRVADGQAAFGWTLWLRWGAGIVLCAVLPALLLEAQGFLRRRFRRRYNAWLLAGMLLVCVCPLMVLFAWQTHRALHGATTVLAGRPTGTGINATAVTVQDDLRGTIWRASAFWAVPAAGAGLALAVQGGFQARLRDYGTAPRRRTT